MLLKQEEKKNIILNLVFWGNFLVLFLDFFSNAGLFTIVNNSISWGSQVKFGGLKEDITQHFM